MTEKKLWRKIRKAWRGHAVRVEASMGGVDPGTPDANLSIGGRGGWVELKVWPEKLSVEQVAWHLDATAKGAYAVVLCGVKRKAVWLGSAEEYDGLKTCPEGISLQRALNMIECALIR